MPYLGFQECMRGSHHQFDKEGVVEIINMQSRGSHAKPYRLKQVRELSQMMRLVVPPI